MRIRSIKPEFWRSPDVSALRIEDRLLFIGLWSYVDDNGVGQDRLSLICADLFADDLSRDPRETFARVSEGLGRLHEAGRIVRYTVEDRGYLAVSGWSKHQRIDKPNKPRFPLPTCDDAEIARPSRDIRETLAPGTGEQGNRGTGEQEDLLLTADAASDRPTPYTDAFLEWWQHYPRKQDKGAAFKAWRKIQGVPLDTLIAGADRYAQDPNREDQFTKHAASWLNARAWEDETPLPQRAGKPDSTSRLASIQALKRRGGDDGWTGMRALTS